MHIARRPIQIGLTSVAIALLATSHAGAQAFTLAPTLGLYAPTTDLVNSLTSGGSTIAFKQKVGLALGGRLGLKFGPRFGITATGSYVPSKLQATVTETGVAQDAANSTDLWFGTGRLSVWLLPPSSILSLGLNGGAGVVGRGATTVIDDNGTSHTDVARTDLGAVVGGTIGVNLRVFGVFISVDDYIYQPSVFEQLGVKSETQNDFQFSVGLGGRF